MSEIKSQLLFDEEAHVYTLHRDGMADIVLPSVTEIMKPLSQQAYDGISERILDTAADRGTRVHRAVEFYLKYHFKNVDEDCTGYFDGIMQFLNQHKDWKPLHSEYRFYHKSLMYAGTCDLLFDTPQGVTLVDLKTTAQAHKGMWGVQLAGYKAGLESYCPTLKISATKVLQAFKDGTYTLHDVKQDFPTFLACLQIKNFKED